MARGDITAGEVYADREMLNRLGYGIFDVTWGHDGVGFENVRDFSYVVAQDQDPKLYRRKVFNLIGRYFNNDLAKELWYKFIDHKWVLSEKAGHEISLIEAANDWFENYGHAFLKDWTFKQSEVPERIRNTSEPTQSFLDVVAGRILPPLRELFQAGFSVVDVARAALHEATSPGYWRSLPRTGKKKPHRRCIHISPRLRSKIRLKPLEDSGDGSDKRWQDNNQYLTIQKLKPKEIGEGRYYSQLVAHLTGHEPKSPEEAERRWREILEHKWYMSEKAGHDVGIRSAAVDYFKRLNLLQEAEQGYEG